MPHSSLSTGRSQRPGLPLSPSHAWGVGPTLDSNRRPAVYETPCEAARHQRDTATPRDGARFTLRKGNGWRGRIRTFNPLIQSQVPYRLATRQRCRQDSRGRRVRPPTRRPSRARSLVALRCARGPLCGSDLRHHRRPRARDHPRHRAPPARDRQDALRLCRRGLGRRAPVLRALGPLPRVRGRGPPGRRGALPAHRGRGVPARGLPPGLPGRDPVGRQGRRVRHHPPPHAHPGGDGRDAQRDRPRGHGRRSTPSATRASPSTSRAGRCWVWPSTWAPRRWSSASSI